MYVINMTVWRACTKDGRIEPMGLTHQRHTLAFRQVGSDEASVSSYGGWTSLSILQQCCRGDSVLILRRRMYDLMNFPWCEVA